jgi:ABC-type nitrate/sulfonate/bicarbonate transport system ATPase subunit
LLKVEELSFAYDARALFRALSFELAAGETAALTGPSGVGKTTLARLVTGHLRPASGRILLSGRDLTGRPSRRIFLVGQDSDLFPWQTALRHLEFVRGLGVVKAGAPEPAEALRWVGLEAVARSYPRALSGGMQKRLALARALVLDPDVVVLDETLASQDEALRNELWARLRPYWEKRGTGVLLISHDEEMVRRERLRRIALPEGGAVG